MTYQLLTPREFVERLRAEGNEWAPEILDALDAADSDETAASELEGVRGELVDETRAGERTYETIERLLAERDELDDVLAIPSEHAERLAACRRAADNELAVLELLAVLAPYGVTDTASALRTLRMLIA